MVIHTERNRDEEHLIAAFRSIFDVSVMNFGSYNLLYAENLLGQTSVTTGGLVQHADQVEELSVQEAVVASRSLLVGYRREPVELVLCPVDPERALKRIGASGKPVPEVPALVNLTNLAGLATDEQTAEIAFSTGRRIRLNLKDRVVFDQVPETPLHQKADVEDFYEFLHYFMDRVEEDQK